MLPVWFDGHLVEPGDPRLDTLSDPKVRPIGCTTARVRAGQPWHEAAHRERLHRDASVLGAGNIDDDAISALWAELSRAAFGAEAEREGIIRIEVHPAWGDGRARLLGVPRELASDATAWKVRRCPAVHPGPGPHDGAKLVYLPAYEQGRAESARLGVDESLLFDRQDRLIEGARSNILVVDKTGCVTAPDPALGAVRGVGLSVLRSRVDGIGYGEIRPEDLREAREIIAINAVRGVRAVVETDGEPVGSGAPGAVAREFEAALA